MPDFHWIDFCIMGGYLLLLLVIGFWNARKNPSEESFLYASRKLTLPSFVMTLVATWYGLILGVGEMIYYYGIMAWVVNGLVFYLVYLLYAKYFAPKIQASHTPTIAGVFEQSFGKTSGIIAGVITAIMTSPAAYILSLVVVFEYFFSLYEITSIWGVSVHLFLLVGLSVFSGIYIFFDGFKAVIKTDVIQFFLMFFGFISLLVFAVYSYGGIGFLLENNNIPAESHFTVPGSMGWQMTIVWALLALWTFVDPNFYQRCFSAGSKKVAQKGIFIAIGFWFVFDILTLATGLYALGVFPLVDKGMGYLYLANEVLPLGLKGLFFTAIFAIIMSTIDSFLFASSSIFAKDFYQKIFPNISLKTLTRWGIVTSVLLSIFLVLQFESIITLIYSVGTVGVALLLPPLFLLLFTKKKITEDQLLFSLAISFLLLLYWLFYGYTHLEYGFPVYLWGIEPMYPGIALNTFLILVFVLYNENKKVSEKIS
jgi:SSS family solute:Na+ symporter